MYAEEGQLRLAAVALGYFVYSEAILAMGWKLKVMHVL